jgi:hypothetical protein
VPARASAIFAQGKLVEQNKNGRIAVMTETVERTYTDEDGKKHTIAVRRVLRATERNFERDGTPRLIPDVEIEGWWTSLAVPKEKVIELYKGHALCEQYHSELKSDLDLERLPSGKFATNALVMHCAGLAYNILRAVAGPCASAAMRPIKPRRLPEPMPDLPMAEPKLFPQRPETLRIQECGQLRSVEIRRTMPETNL